MTIFDFDNWLLEQARTMPRAMNKGGTTQASQNMATANAENTSLLNQGQAEENAVLPFLKTRVRNGRP